MDSRQCRNDGVCVFGAYFPCWVQFSGLIILRLGWRRFSLWRLALLVLAFTQIGAQGLCEAAVSVGIVLAHFASIWRDVLDPSIAFVHRRASLRLAKGPIAFCMVTLL